MRTILTAKNRPTPTDTVAIRAIRSMPGTLVARTCKSGSATVMTTPMIKLRARISQMFRDLVSLAPIRLPIWLMDCSDPKVNRAIPAMIMTVPTKKDSISPDPTGTKKKQSRLTISAMGSTESTASCNFSESAFLRIKS